MKEFLKPTTTKLVASIFFTLFQFSLLSGCFAAGGKICGFNPMVWIFGMLGYYRVRFALFLLLLIILPLFFTYIFVCIIILFFKMIFKNHLIQIQNYRDSILRNVDLLYLFKMSIVVTIVLTVILVIFSLFIK